ncbi:MAG: glycosyltransferase family 1 protein [Rhodospirillaceae bacterium]|nr:glycosyltransferase family 1 protein [Rhodospirillaceae bacterium]
MRILIASDAWKPQVSGVVRTLSTVIEHLAAGGHVVEVIGPDRFRTVPLPGYPQIRLAVRPGGRLGPMIEAFAPDAVHIPVEGPIGWAARRHCLRRGFPFTTSYLSQFPDYVAMRTAIPRGWTWAVLRRFHGRAARTMVATPTLEALLRDRGFANLARWSRGVDVGLFRPDYAPVLDLPRPIAVYVGRVAVEKNIEAFLSAQFGGTKLVVGDGPQRAALERRFPDAVFVGEKHGAELAAHYAMGDVFVFPSRTDTFGLVMLEALACGVPVAAYPVPGPLDVITDPAVGCLNEDLSAAMATALTLSRAACRRFAEGRSWQASADQFLANLVPAGGA